MINHGNFDFFSYNLSIFENQECTLFHTRIFFYTAQRLSELQSTGTLCMSYFPK